MAAEEESNKKLMRLMSLMIAGMAKGLYEMFGESAFAVMSETGKSILEILEKEMNLKVDGKEPSEVLNAIGRIFADEMGFVDSFAVSREGNRLTVTVHGCQGWDMTQAVLKTGVEVPFTCPIMNVCQAALIRMGSPARKTISPIPETHGSTIVFTLIE
jgi:starvation-inducible outer membrane lipoprotein